MQSKGTSPNLKFQHSLSRATSMRISPTFATAKSTPTPIIEKKISSLPAEIEIKIKAPEIKAPEISFAMPEAHQKVDLVELFDESHKFTTNILQKLEGKFKNKFQDFNPVDLVQKTYQQILKHLENQVIQIVLKLVSNNIGNEYLIKIKSFVEGFKNIIASLTSLNLTVDFQAGGFYKKHIELLSSNVVIESLFKIITSLSGHYSPIHSSFIVPVLHYINTIIRIVNPFMIDIIKFVPKQYHQVLQVFTDTIKTVFDLINLTGNSEVENHEDNFKDILNKLNKQDFREPDSDDDDDDEQEYEETLVSNNNTTEDEKLSFEEVYPSPHVS